MFWKLQTKLPEYSFLVTLVLGLSVWIIYVLDRLLDNKKSTMISTRRHVFHQANQRILWFLVIICTCICAGLLFFIPGNIIKFGLIIASITGFYLFIVNQISVRNSLQSFKEPVTAFVYVSGVFGTTALSNLSIFSSQIGFIFLLIVFQNLLLFSLFELKKDSKIVNLASCLEIPKSNFLIIILTCVVLILGLIGDSNVQFVYFKYQQKVFYIEILMSVILLIINTFDKFFLANDRYRWMADSIFLLPLLIIF
jgi:hypothetical protein